MISLLNNTVYQGQLPYFNAIGSLYNKKIAETPVQLANERLSAALEYIYILK